MAYLSRYVKGDPINNTQMRPSPDDRITFHYTDYRDPRVEPLSLSHAQFIQRLWYTPESGQYTKGKTTLILWAVIRRRQDPTWL